MNKVQLSKELFPDQYWIRYRNEDGYCRNISLSACANSFRLVTNGAYADDDGMRCVGWRYEEDGDLCYELFSIGHLVLTISLTPSLIERVCCLVQGKDVQEVHREKIMAFEAALNRGGWKTICKKISD